MRDLRAQAGERIRNRRLTLGYRSQAALAKAAGVGARMVAAVETGERVGANTKLRLDRALQWAEGGIDTLLNGGEPALLEDHQPEPELTDEERLNRMAETAREWIKAGQDMLAELEEMRGHGRRSA